MAEPKVRFKRDDGNSYPDWESCRIGDYLTESRITGNTGMTAKKLTVKLWGKGVFEKNTPFEGSNATQYYKRSSGQFIYGKLDFLHGAFGIIPPELDGYESTLDSPAFDIKDINPKFLLELVGREKFYLSADDTASGSRKAKRIHPNVFCNMLISVPCKEEQKKIADFLCNVDSLIELSEQELAKIKELKKGCLQKMFPKEGTEIPEIRFPEFSGPWERRQLSDYLKVSKVKNKDEKYTKVDVLSVSGDYGIVNQIEFQGRSFAGVSVAPYGVVDTYDVVYTKSPLKSNPYGIIKTNKGNSGIVSTLYAVYKPLENTCSEFVQIYFELDSRMNNYMGPLVNKGAKNDMKVSDENALKGNVVFPSKQEQIRISEYFEQLDNLITLHQRECDKYKELKKALLQQLFV